MQALRECQNCGQQELLFGNLNDYYHCHHCEEEERTNPVNPVDTHTLVADLADLGHAPHATTPAISFAQADADGGEDSVDDTSVVEPSMARDDRCSQEHTTAVHEAAVKEQSPQDDIPTPEQMWGHGGIANTAVDTALVDTLPSEHSLAGCSRTHLHTRTLVPARTVA